MNKIRVLVVDDSLFMRKVISDLLNSDSEIEVVGQASNGLDALKLIQELQPDVVTLDYEMPKMNGLQTLEELTELPIRPRVIMVSGYTQKDAEITWRCLDVGAIDFVLKPSGSLSMDMYKVSALLIEKVKIAAQADSSGYYRIRNKTNFPPKTNFKVGVQGAVVIGASTGGPAALEVLLPKFPENFPLPVFIAQHLPKYFTKSLSQRLAKSCQLQVIEGYDGLKVHPGVIYFAPGGVNTEVIKDQNHGIVLKTSEKLYGTETPSVDHLMLSVATVYQENTVGIILTGMGRDGCRGMEAIKRTGGKTLVQDESTSVIFGMGREVVERKLADDIVPLNNIVSKIVEMIN